MSDVKIITNNVPREIIEGYLLSPSERAEFDYLDWKAIEDGSGSASFFRYKGELYDIGEFTAITSVNTIHPEFNGWHAIQPDSYFSGLVVRYPEDPDFTVIVVGRYTS